MGYDAARSGAQCGVGVAGCAFDRAQSRGNVAADRARHAISAGRIEANRDKYQPMVMRSVGAKVRCFDCDAHLRLMIDDGM